MTPVSDNSHSRAMHLSMSIFMNAYTELEDALHWTHELLAKLDSRSTGPGVDLQCVTDRSIAIRSLLQLVAIDERPSQTVIDDILRECLVTQALYERVAATRSNADEPGRTTRFSGNSRSLEIRRHAGQILRLAARVLSLHALYYPPNRNENSYARLGRAGSGEVRELPCKRALVHGSSENQDLPCL